MTSDNAQPLPATTNETAPRVSVVIPAHNEERYIGACLAHIRASAAPHPCEVIVVDNASTDRTAAIAREAGVRVVPEPQKGTNHARQRGLLAATGDLVAFIDADVLLPREWFAAAVSAFAAHPEAVAASGPCEYYDLSPFNRWVTGRWNDAAHISGFLTGAQVMGGNVILRRQIFLDAGGFDTSRTFYGDDVDTGKRLHGTGKVLFLPALTTQMSGRRLARRGVLRVGYEYAMAYFSEKFFGKPWKHEHTVIR